jgi:hypothetical protein
MIYLIDGSNVLGRLQRDRESGESKRQLARQISGLMKSEGSRAILFFDGEQPEQFRGGVERVAIRFAGRKPADELIQIEAQAHQKCTVVTSDRTLEARVRSRKVAVIDVMRFSRRLDVIPEEGGAGEADWEAFFSDEKNRNI